MPDGEGEEDEGARAPAAAPGAAAGGPGPVMDEKFRDRAERQTLKGLANVSDYDPTVTSDKVESKQAWERFITSVQDSVPLLTYIFERRDEDGFWPGVLAAHIADMDKGPVAPQKRRWPSGLPCPPRAFSRRAFLAAARRRVL